MMISVDICIG